MFNWRQFSSRFDDAILSGEGGQHHHQDRAERGAEVQGREPQQLQGGQQLRQDFFFLPFISQTALLVLSTTDGAARIFPTTLLCLGEFR